MSVCAAQPEATVSTWFNGVGQVIVCAEYPWAEFGLYWGRHKPETVQCEPQENILGCGMDTTRENKEKDVGEN